MSGVAGTYNLTPTPPPGQRHFITTADSDSTGTLWERVEGKAVEKSLVANYTKIEDIQNGWYFERMFQRPVTIQASSLQLACVRFLQSMGVQGHIRVSDGWSSTM